MREGFMIRHRRRGAIALRAVALTTLVLVGAAVAYWTTMGAGLGSAPTAGVLDISLSAGIPSAELYPGAATDVAVTATNPNPFPLRLGSLSLNSAQGTAGFGVDAPHAACGLATLSFAAQSNGGAGWTIPPKVGATNGTLAIDLSGALAMSAGAANACQGASFVVHLTAGA
jgi:hypothetical protein